MPATCVIGLQWGDEAKGKIVDLLTLRHDIVVRYQGGANAGHTVVADGNTYKFSHLPSGILTPGIRCVIAAGMVVNPKTLLEELDHMTARGIEDVDNLLLSDRAHIIFPWHFFEDRLLDENCSGGERIGTTQRGIGPCYRDKVGRSYAIRLGDMVRDGFREKIEHVLKAKKKIFSNQNGQFTNKTLDAADIYQQYAAYAHRLRPYVTDTTEYLLNAIESGKRILFEGAQGSLLDIDHGTFPYVTSSNSAGVGVSNGSGIPGRHISKVIGVMKAYVTRVGGGPFPTEQDNETGNHIRERGNEYGTVTKRPRRCGWADTVALRYATKLSGVDSLAVMLLDVLSELSEIKICTAYELAGKRITRFPSHVDDLRNVVPIYETFPGWKTPITSLRTLKNLPQAAQNYLGRLSELIERPVEIVSVGPDRQQTMFSNRWLSETT